METVPGFYVNPDKFMLRVPLHSVSASADKLHTRLKPGNHSNRLGVGDRCANVFGNKTAGGPFSGNGRSRSPLVPLRNRQLPASFWQEPNVPRGYSYPFWAHSFPFHPFSVGWNGFSSTASSVASGVKDNSSTGSSNNSSKQTTEVHSSKEFLARLQSAQAWGYDVASSRFPITEFLFYNYGLKSYLQPSESFAPEGPRRTPQLPCLPSSTPEDHVIKGDSSRFGDGNPPRGTSLAFPTLCPYLGYNCPNLHSQTPHRFWDCVLSQKVSTTDDSSVTSSSLASTSLSMLSRPSRISPVGQLWKPVAGRTESVYPRRYHPFTSA